MKYDRQHYLNSVNRILARKTQLKLVFGWTAAGNFAVS